MAREGGGSYDGRFRMREADLLQGQGRFIATVLQYLAYRAVCDEEEGVGSLGARMSRSLDGYLFLR